MTATIAFLLLAGVAGATPLRVGVVGLVHGHAGGFFQRTAGRTDFQVTGIVEPDRELAARYVTKYKLEATPLFTDLDAMLDQAKPEAVLVFTNTYDHARVVEACAKRGIHVMMEKPLAVNVEQARAMDATARRGNIHVLVNYETTWYASNRAVWNIFKEQKAAGDIRKIVVHDGHQGPKEIGVGPEFLSWLTDPKLNGAGALFDFGCYGADLITWLMDGQRPTSVTAVTQQIKPDIYPHVDDEATVILTYPHAQGIIQASWNWTFDRKDMEVYGQTGTVFTVRRDDVLVRLGTKAEEQSKAPPLASPFDDPLNYFAAVVHGQIPDAGLSSLKINIVVTEILDAARRSAQTGKTVQLGVSK